MKESNNRTCSVCHERASALITVNKVSYCLKCARIKGVLERFGAEK